MFELASLPQDMGQIVVQGITLGRLAFRRLFTLTTIMAFLGLVPTAFLVWGTGDDVMFDLTNPINLLQKFDGPYGWSAVVVTLASLLPQAVLLRRIALTARGQKEAPEAELRQALRLWPWMIVALVIYVLALCFGFILLFIPGLILAFSLMFVEYVVVLEGQRPLEALNTSHNLVWGHWWRTVGIVLLVYIPLLVAESILSAILGLGPTDSAAAHGRDLFKQAVLEMVFLAVFSPFVFSILYLYYHDLKLRKQQR